MEEEGFFRIFPCAGMYKILPTWQPWKSYPCMYEACSTYWKPSIVWKQQYWQTNHKKKCQTYHKKFSLFRCLHRIQFNIHFFLSLFRLLGYHGRLLSTTTRCFHPFLLLWFAAITVIRRAARVVCDVEVVFLGVLFALVCVSCWSSLLKSGSWDDQIRIILFSPVLL